MSRLGTGRVMSQMTTQASLRPRASSASGGGGRTRQLATQLRQRIGQRRGVLVTQRADDALVGQLDLKPRPAVFERDAHGSVGWHALRNEGRGILAARLRS